MELPANTIRRYIPKSWKKFTTYISSIVTSPMKLFRRYFTKGWKKITPNATANHRRNYSIDIFRLVKFVWRIFCL